MRLEEMSFADYLKAEYEWREKQRRKRLKRIGKTFFIKSKILLHPDDEYVMQQRILKQLEDGIVILPEYCEIVYPTDISVLGQIRAEIADLPIRPEYQQTEHEKGFIDATNRALQILDKYTEGESE